MNRYPERFARIAAVGLALIMVAVWSVMTFAYAYSQSLSHMNDSFTRGLNAVSVLDEFCSTVDRLSLDQRAFLSTGDHRFLEGVWSGTVILERHLDSIRTLTAGRAQRARAARLPAAARQVLDSLARSYDIKDARGAGIFRRP